jgi:hypothetical protein|tara:strand:+ start:607 stop:771 length:165 start_codon:yes stop_codon:yes gene_type:complete
MSEHGSSGVDVEMTILGSGACNPSPFRSASALALRVRNLVGNTAHMGGQRGPSS